MYIYKLKTVSDKQDTKKLTIFLYDVIDEQNHLVYRDVDEDKDIVFHDTKSITLSDSLSKHPIVKNKHVS